MTPYVVICSTQSCGAVFRRCLTQSPRSEQYRPAARNGWAIVITGMETVVPFCPKCHPVLNPILETRPDQQL